MDGPSGNDPSKWTTDYEHSLNLRQGVQKPSRSEDPPDQDGVLDGWKSVATHRCSSQYNRSRSAGSRNWSDGGGARPGVTPQHMSVHTAVGQNSVG